MNPEKASLKHALDQEEQPGPGVWTEICEQLDRQELGRKLHLHAAQPPNSTWYRIRPTRRIRPIPVAAASIALGIICGLVYLQLASSSDLLTDPMVKIQSEESRDSERTESLSSGLIKTAEPDSMRASIIQVPVNNSEKRTIAPIHDDANYLWVAAENGKPIRVPKKWSSLSCCLSGESESTECKIQQNAWHYELACSGLGFQADPILGLMELMVANDEP